MKRLSWGTFPSREEWDAAWAADPVIQRLGGTGYSITHGSLTDEYDPPAGIYTCEGLWNEVCRLWQFKKGATAEERERAEYWVSDILGTLGFEWI